MTVEQMLARKRELGYTYEMIAEKSGVPVSTVQKILGGFTETPRYDTLLALEAVLGYEKQGQYTVDDLEMLPDDVRAELIDGVIYDLASPRLNHQRAVLEIAYQIENFIQDAGGDCEVFVSPVDVRLDCDDRTSVQPDVFVVCESDKLGETKVMGAPDWCVEVLSPSTEKKDKWVKLNKYKKSGVREYWLIDCENEGVLCYDYMHGRFETYSLEDRVPVAIYDGKLEIDFAPVAKKLKK